MIKLNLGLWRAGKFTADKMRNGVVTFRQRYGRGWGLLGDYVKQPTIALTAVAWWSDWLLRNTGMGIPTWVMYIFIPFWFIFWYSLGWFDQFKLKIWQKEAEWGARNINPFEQEVLKRIKKIEKCIKKQ
jgi:hypothetical protein